MIQKASFDDTDSERKHLRKHVIQMTVLKLLIWLLFTKGHETIYKLINKEASTN